MTEVLLNELSNSDVDWMTTIGHKEEIAAGTVLVEQGKPSEALYIVIDGSLSVSVTQVDNHVSSRASASVEGSKITWEITKLSSGDVVGDIPFVGQHCLPLVTIKTLEKSMVLSIPRMQLFTKLQQDMSFAAHFYRAIAILLSNRLRLINQLGSAKVESFLEQSLKKGLLVLGELNDSDIDWMISAGSKEKIAAGNVLIQQGRPMDALYIILSGTITVLVCHAKISPLSRAFTAKGSGTNSSLQEVERLSTGEIVGERSILEQEHAYGTVKALEDSLVLSLPRQQLVAKLQMNVGFAARFYRAIAAVIEERLRSRIIRIAYGNLTDGTSQMLDAEIEHEDEIDLSILDNTALAGARFDWILKRFRNS